VNVDVHHLNYLLLYHQVQERLVSFLMVVLLFVEKNQAKKKNKIISNQKNIYVFKKE
jgi:hypothetical protein